MPTVLNGNQDNPKKKKLDIDRNVKSSHLNNHPVYKHTFTFILHAYIHALVLLRDTEKAQTTLAFVNVITQIQ